MRYPGFDQVLVILAWMHHSLGRFEKIDCNGLIDEPD